MAFTDLFRVQDKLDTHINGLKGLSIHDVIQEKFLALLVEIGEMANEHREFKFWSNNNRPREKMQCSECGGSGLKLRQTCSICLGDGWYNPLLVEMVDCMHFMFSIGNYYNLGYKEGLKLDFVFITNNVTDLLIDFFQSVIRMRVDPCRSNYEDMWSVFISIKHLMGYGDYQLKEAYMKKNEVNYDRQAEGY